MFNSYSRKLPLAAIISSTLLLFGCPDDTKPGPNGDESDAATDTGDENPADTSESDTTAPDTTEPRDTGNDTSELDTAPPPDTADTRDTADARDAIDTSDATLDGSEVGPDRSCDDNVTLGQNAIANGGGEVDMASDGEVIDVTCWERTDGCFTVMTYADGYGGFQDVKPPNAGDNLLAGGRSCSDGNGTSTGVQTLETELAPITGDIAAGAVDYELSGQLGGWEDQNDSATIEVRFLDATGNELQTASIGPITADDRNNTTKFLARSTTGTVPTTTTSIEIVMRAEKTGSSNNDGVADNLELVFTR